MVTKTAVGVREAQALRAGGFSCARRSGAGDGNRTRVLSLGS